MRRLIFLLLLAVPLAASAQSKTPPTTLRGVLLEQLHTTHDAEDWFVPANIAVQGLTAEQAKWSDGNIVNFMGSECTIRQSRARLRELAEVYRNNLYLD